MDVGPCSSCVDKCCFVFFLFFFLFFFFFFFNDTATTEIYTLSLHDALPILIETPPLDLTLRSLIMPADLTRSAIESESTDQSTNNLWNQPGHEIQIGRAHVWTPVTVNNLVCRLLLEKKKIKKKLKKKKKKKKKDRNRQINTTADCISPTSL